MNKLLDIWRNNKIFIVLGFILIACFIAIIIVTMTYFFGGSDSVYGDRLEGIEDYELTTKLEDAYIDSFKENEKVESVELNDKGKIIYIHIHFTNETSLADAKKIASESIEFLDETLIEFYDLNFVLEIASTDENEGLTIMGAKNIVSEVISWNNNTPIEEDGE